MIEKKSTSFSSAEAEETAEEMIRSSPSLQVIVTLNITQSRAAYAAASRTDSLKRIKLIACDQDLDLLFRLRAGEIDAIVAQDTKKMGKDAIQMIKEHRAGNRSKLTVVVQPILVTLQNVDSPEVQEVLDMNWEGAMMLFDNKKRVLFGVFLLLSISLGTGLLSHFKKPLLKKFQQSYRLNTDQIDSWQSYGGTWDVQHGVLHNNDDERGAKLMSGSTKWQNYTLQADLKFDGERGDIGLIIRSNNEEEGVDAYNGYYVGLRTMDGTLVIGRSAYGWSEAMPLLMPGGVHARIWYRLRITAVGCDLVASSENLVTGQKAWMAFTEHDCVLSGRIGIRSLGTGGTWTSVSVVPADETDYLAMAMHAGPAEQPEFPEREADFNRRIHLLPRANIPEADIGQVASDLHIGDLQNLSRMQMTNVVLRGVVTLTGPNLYVEDSSGGLVIQNPQGPPLNVGDGVQVSGPAEPTVYSAVIHNGAVRLISSGTPFPPFSVTPWQAASGAYDARFVELEGHLQSEVYVENGYQVLDFYEGGEAFRALYADQVGGKLRDLRKNSLIRLRGVCVLGRSYTQDLIPFVLLLRSEDDIEVLAGPPWWTPWHVGMLFIGLLVFASLLQIMYFRIRQWKMNAITQERERLAHDIHDTMAQSFAGIGYQIQGIRTSVLRSEPDSPPPDCRGFGHGLSACSEMS